MSKKMAVLAAWTGLTSGSVALVGGVLVWWALPALLRQFLVDPFLSRLVIVAWYLYTLGLAAFFLSAHMLLRGRSEGAHRLGGRVGSFLALAAGGLTLTTAILWMTGGFWDYGLGPGTTTRIVQGAGLVGPALFPMGIGLGLWPQTGSDRSSGFRRLVVSVSVLAGSVVVAGAILLFVGSFLYAVGPQRTIPIAVEVGLGPTAPAWLVVAPAMYRFGLATFALGLGIFLGTEARGALAGPREWLPAWTGIGALLSGGVIAFLGGLDRSPPTIQRPWELFQSIPGLPFIVPYLALGLLACGISLVLWSLSPPGKRTRSV